MPQDPFILPSVCNTKLRDEYPSLDALCEDLDADRDELVRRLEAVGYTYDEDKNRFL